MTSSPIWQADLRFDLRAYVKTLGGVPAVHGDVHELLVQCPDCNKPKLAVNVQKRSWQCFTCGVGGRDSLSFIAKVQGLAWKDAMERLLTGNQTAIGRIDRLESELGTGQVARPTSWIPPAVQWPESFERVSFATEASRAGVAYCYKRGISMSVAEAMHLGVCTRGKQAGRLVFPVLDHAGRLLFYQGRAMFDADAVPGRRYVKTLGRARENENEAGSGDCLLNLQHVVKLRLTRVLVVEGPVDCAHAWPEAVCLFGKKISPRHIELLMRAGIRELDLGLDLDAEADVKRIAPLLADLFTVRTVRWPDGKDPGQLSEAAIADCRARATVWGSGDRLSRLESRV